MREDPQFDQDAMRTCLETNYGIEVEAIAFLPIGFDYASAVYDVTTGDGSHWFLKVRMANVGPANLLVPRVLTDLGIPNILAPHPTIGGDLSAPLGVDEATVMLYPFIHGQSAMDVGLTEDQWRTFGTTLRAIHNNGLAERFRDGLPVETFALPSADLVRRMIALPASVRDESPVAMDFWDFWDRRAQQIEELLQYVEGLGHNLQSTTSGNVLCHADIHAANILVGDDGQIWLVDWDGPKIAPRERDLLFVVGSRIARSVEPYEEDWFFDGYGEAVLDPRTLIYYRYERIIEDLGEIARQVLLDDTASEESRLADADVAMSFFTPGGNLDRAESVTRTRWP